MTRKENLENPPLPPTWDETVAAFEQHLYARGRAETTVATYGSALRVFGAFYRESLGKPGHYPSRLAETDVFAFVDHLRRDRLLSAASLNRFVSALRAFARFLLERHWHRRDLGRELRTFRTARPAAPLHLSPEEVRRLVTSVAVDVKETIYPRLPDILSEDELAAIATLEPGERDFATAKGSAAQHYLRALSLKGMAHLGHAQLAPRNLSRQFRLRIAEELELETGFADIRSLSPADKSRIVREVRPLLGLQEYSRARRAEIECWLRDGPAAEHGDPVAVINATIARFRELRIELPPFPVIQTIAASAAAAADQAVEERFVGLLGARDARKLDAVLDGAGAGDDEAVDAHRARTHLERLEAPIGKIGVATLERELERLRQIREYPLAIVTAARIGRRKVEQLAAVASRYHASELRQLADGRRRLILACYLAVRRSELLDAVVDLLIAVWSATVGAATDHANSCAKALMAAHEEILQELKSIVGIIRHSDTNLELWRGIFTHKTREEYDELYACVEGAPTWSEAYHAKLGHHYGALRRFLKEWYELVPVVAVTTDDSLVRAVRFLLENVTPDEVELPAAGAPVDCLAAEWSSRAVQRHARTGVPIRIEKARYELGVVDALSDALKHGRLAVAGARRYAPMTQHLLPREQFLEQYQQHLLRINQTDRAEDGYASVRAALLTNHDALRGEVRPLCTALLGQQERGAFVLTAAGPTALGTRPADCRALAGPHSAGVRARRAPRLPSIDRVSRRAAADHGCPAHERRAAAAPSSGDALRLRLQLRPEPGGSRHRAPQAGDPLHAPALHRRPPSRRGRRRPRKRL
ncbi:MAG: DUF4158 domain-containing protein [Candidatus Schekmanbacteria bacterium]|nr:DUF4158 domain-containing protein [Candidatus Schekmanbacteria bacterium]